MSLSMMRREVHVSGQECLFKFRQIHLAHLFPIKTRNPVSRAVLNQDRNDEQEQVSTGESGTKSEETSWESSQTA